MTDGTHAGFVELYAVGTSRATYFFDFITMGEEAGLEPVSRAVLATVRSPSSDKRPEWLIPALAVLGLLAVAVTAAFLVFRPRRKLAASSWPSRE